METSKMLEKANSINALLAQDGAAFEVGVREVYKPNVGELSGFELRPLEGDGCVRPMVYPEEQFHFMEDSDLAAFMEQVYASKKAEMETINVNLSRRNIAASVLPKVLSYERNAEMLLTHGIPFVEVPGTDLLAIFYIPAAKDGTVTITDSILDRAGLTVDEIYAGSCSNILGHMQVKSLFSMLSEISGNNTPCGMEMGGPGSPLWVMTTDRQLFGAGVLAAGREALVRMGSAIRAEQFFILPSSVHELLLLMDNGSIDPEFLLTMVTEINAAQVAPEEQLTDNVYHYDMATDKLSRYR